MHDRLPITRLLFCSGVLVTVFSNAAEAFDRQVTFCNRTKTDVFVAVAADLEGTSQITTSGWFKASACSCQTVLNARLRATEVFVYAKWTGTRGNVLDNARAPLCVKHGVGFDLVRENDNQASCERSGGFWDFFKFYDTANSSSKRINLRIPGECNLMGGD